MSVSQLLIEWLKFFSDLSLISDQASGLWQKQSTFCFYSPAVHEFSHLAFLKLSKLSCLKPCGALHGLPAQICPQSISACLV